MNPADAEIRGIRDGDTVLVYNDRGTISINAWVTRRIIPGVVAMPEGAWYSPDEDGVDRGGCANTLTKDAMSEGGAAALKTCLVQVKLEKEGP